MKKYLIATILLAITITADIKALVINELMQSNVTTLFVENEFPDSWVELYNNSDSDIALDGYAIGDSDNFEKAWVIDSDEIVTAGSHILIYCDKEEKGLHTDFRVDSGKGEIYLFSPSGEILDKIDFAKMPSPDVAYGRETDFSDQWGYMLIPTPGCENYGGVTENVLPAPLFSHEGALLAEPITLTISLPDEELPSDVKLSVSLDGSEPTESNIVELPCVLNIESTTVVRATLISSEAVSIKPTTHSYIYHPRQTDLPIVSIATNHNYLYDTETGILGIPTEDGQNTDIDWRRPINIELFQIPEKATFNQIGETRMQGHHSRRYAQRSLHVYSNKRFGTKRFNGVIWENKPEMNEIKSFSLRNGGNDFAGAKVRDAFIQTLFGRNLENLDYMEYQPCICYINGVYKGIYNMRERSNEDWVEVNYDGLEDIDMLENWGEVKAGDIQSLYDFMDIYNNENVTSEEIAAKMDIEEFINMFVLEAFVANTDYPSNNIVMWKPCEEGGKWRWIVKDVDRVAHENYDYDYFNHIYSFQNNGNEWHSRTIKLFNCFLEIPELQSEFIDRFTVYMGDFMEDEFVENYLYSLRDAVEDEYLYHCEVYFDDPTAQFESWKWLYGYISRWWSDRREFMCDYLSDYFQLGKPIPVEINRSENQIDVNGIRLTQDVFKGKFFADRKMTISSEDEVNYIVNITNNNGEESEEIFYENQIELTLTEEIQSVVVKPMLKTSLPENELKNDIAIYVAENEVVIKGDCIKSATLYDASGVAIRHNENINANQSGFSMLNPGLYVVKIVKHNGEYIVEKVVI